MNISCHDKEISFMVSVKHLRKNNNIYWYIFHTYHSLLASKTRVGRRDVIGIHLFCDPAFLVGLGVDLLQKQIYCCKLMKSTETTFHSHKVCSSQADKENVCTFIFLVFY